MPYDTHGRWIPPDDAWRTKSIKYNTETRQWQEAYAVEGGYTLSWDDLHDESLDPQNRNKRFTWDRSGNYDMKGLIKSGFLDEALGITDDMKVYKESGEMDVDLTLGSMFDTSHWNMRWDNDGRKKWDILERFQDYYYGDDDYHWLDGKKVQRVIGETESGEPVLQQTSTIIGFDEELRNDPSWGMDIQRTWRQEGVEKKGYDAFDDNKPEQIFHRLIGLDSDEGPLNDFFWITSGAHADYSDINTVDNNIFNAARRFIFTDENGNPDSSKIDGKYAFLQDYDSVEQIREVNRLWNEGGLTDQEKLDAQAWADQHVTPHLELEEEDAERDEMEPQEFYRTMKWDADTNTMHYYEHRLENTPVLDPITGEAKTTTIKPPGAMSSLLITNESDITRNEDGVRMLDSNSATNLYEQYLGRTMTSDESNDVLDKISIGTTFDDFANTLKTGDEAQANKSNWRNRYYNPQSYGTAESIKAGMASAPEPISAPTITIRNIGQPRKPTNSYMALPSHWLTQAPNKVARETPVQIEVQNDAIQI